MTQKIKKSTTLAVGLVMVVALVLLFIIPNRFDQEAWSITDRLGYPVYRSGMANDLMKNHLRKEMIHDEVVELLADSMAVAYRHLLDRPVSGAAEQTVHRELSDAKAAYLGTWKHATDNGGWVEVTIGADKLVWLTGNGYGYTLSRLTWEAMDEPTGNADYPTGYKITGRLDEAVIYALTRSEDHLEAAFIGERALNWWYIHRDGQSLMMGIPIPSHEAIGQPFVKQPEGGGVE
jgi:hypothetical protein